MTFPEITLYHALQEGTIDYRTTLYHTVKVCAVADLELRQDL